jgi:transcriptional regulator with XRE-family HTH domain
MVARMQATLAEMQQLASRLGLAAGAQALITNGRVVPLEAGVTLSATDLEVATYYALEMQPGAQVQKVIEAAQGEGRTLRSQLPGACHVSMNATSHLRLSSIRKAYTGSAGSE